jgi:hypothetical protein
LCCCKFLIMHAQKYDSHPKNWKSQQHIWQK